MEMIGSLRRGNGEVRPVVQILTDMPAAVLLQMIDEFLLMRERLLLAECSPSVAAFIGGSSSLWQRISFGAAGELLTDAGLAALLDRVGALQHTVVLSLQGCTKITGQGLSSLRGSVVLEELDLRTVPHGQESHLDTASIANVLETMLPLHPDDDLGQRLRVIQYSWAADPDRHLRALTGDLWNAGRVEEVRRSRVPAGVRALLCDYGGGSGKCSGDARPDMRPCARCKKLSCWQGKCDTGHDCCMCATYVCGDCDMGGAYN